MKNERDQDEEDLKFENEVKKLKITAEYGGDFGPLESEKLSPGLESKWLDSIMAFEKAMEEKKTIRIGKLLEDPIFTPISGIPEQSLTAELEKVMDLFAEKGIVVETIHGATAKELYCFITEELVDEEMNWIEAEGWVTHYIYEEFYPNHEEDLKNAAFEFIDAVAKQNVEYLDHQLCSKCQLNGKKVEATRYKDFLTSQLATIEDIDLKSSEIINVSISSNLKKAEVILKLQFTTWWKIGRVESYNHRAKIRFRCVYGYWCIHSVDLPPLLNG